MDAVEGVRLDPLALLLFFCGVRMTVSSSSSTSIAAFRKEAIAALRSAAAANAEADTLEPLAGAKAHSIESDVNGNAAKVVGKDSGQPPRPASWSVSDPSLQLRDGTGKHWSIMGSDTEILHPTVFIPVNALQGVGVQVLGHQSKSTGHQLSIAALADFLEVGVFGKRFIGGTCRAFSLFCESDGGLEATSAGSSLDGGLLGT